MGEDWNRRFEETVEQRIKDGAHIEDILVTDVHGRLVNLFAPDVEPLGADQFPLVCSVKPDEAEPHFGSPARRSESRKTDDSIVTFEPNVSTFVAYEETYRICDEDGPPPCDLLPSVSMPIICDISGKRSLAGPRMQLSAPTAPDCDDDTVEYVAENNNTDKYML